MGVGAVYPVVGGHDRQGLSLPNGNFEIGEIQLPQGPLVDHAVTGHPQQLLGVGCQVLGAGGNAILLHPADEGGGQLSRQVRILGEIFKIPAPQRIALGVQARPQQYIDPLRHGLLPDGPAAGLDQLRVPAVGQGRGGGKAGGRLAGVKPQMVPPARLPAHPVGAV